MGRYLFINFDFENLVIFESLCTQHNSIVELLCRVTPVSCSIVVA